MRSRLSLPIVIVCSSLAVPVVSSAQVHAQTYAQTHAKRVAAAPACPPVPSADTASAPVTPPGLPPATGPVQTAFALRYIDMVIGTGAVAQPGDFVTVQYTGWLAANGQKFDSSLDRNQPFTFPLGEHQVIPGWDMGFDGMRVGGKRRLFIPWQLAYGTEGQAVIPPKSDLIFDIELLAAGTTPPGETPAPPAPATPPPASSGAPQ